MQFPKKKNAGEKYTCALYQCNMPRLILSTLYTQYILCHQDFIIREKLENTLKLVNSILREPDQQILFFLVFQLKYIFRVFSNFVISDIDIWFLTTYYISAIVHGSLQFLYHISQRCYQHFN